MMNMYNHLSDDQLYLEFTIGKWVVHTPEERKELMQEIENRVAKEQKRPAMKISVISPENDAPGVAGYHIPGREELFINSRYFTLTGGAMGDYSAAAALDTVLHEGRHAFQYDYMRCPDDRATMQMGLEWALNTCLYQSGTTELQFSLYVFQPLELDARRYARQRLRLINLSIQKQNGRFDPAFSKQVNDCILNERICAGLALKNISPAMIDYYDRKAIARFKEHSPDVDLEGVSLFRETMHMFRVIDQLSDAQDLIGHRFEARYMGFGMRFAEEKEHQMLESLEDTYRRICATGSAAAKYNPMGKY